MNDKRQFRTAAGLWRRGDSWTPLLGRFMLSVTWENVLEHVAGALNDWGSRGRGFESRRPDQG